MKIIKELRRRERKAYPAYMRQMQDMRTWADLQEYCESNQVGIRLLGADGYLITTEDEVVDWVGGNSNPFELLTIINNVFGGKPFKADLRETTSWPIIKRLVDKNKLILHSVEVWFWEEEKMFAVVIEKKERR